MNDLLPKSLTKGTTYVDLKQDVMRDLEMGDVGDANEDRNLNAFFSDVNAIKNDMEMAKQLLSKLQTANEEGKKIHKAQAMKALRERMDRDVEEVLKKAKSIKVNLEDLDKANLANRSYPGCEYGTPIDRTRTSITNSLRKKLKDLMEEYQLLRHQIMVEYKETVERRYYTVTGQHPDEDTIEEIIKTGESENFLHKAIREQGRGQVTDTIRELQERHDAAKEIEQNLLDLHQIFLDMSILVETQGEHLNDIQHHVSQANVYMEHGTQQLRDAKHYQRNSRKYFALVIIILLILILVVVIPLATSFKN